MRPYRKDDKTRLWIINVIGIVMVGLLTYLIVSTSENLNYVLIVLETLLAIVTMVFLQYRFVLKPIIMRHIDLIYEGYESMDFGSLRDELKLVEFAYNKSPQKMSFYLDTLFSGFRICDGPEATKYLDPALARMKRIKNVNMKANFTIELCYYYLMMNDIEMFLLAVKKLKTYHHTTFEKLVRRIEKFTKLPNKEEHKELAFIAKLYEQGPDEEKIEKLVSHPMPYYRMIYTFYILNYYKSLNNDEKIKEYKEKFDQYQGDVYPVNKGLI